MSLSFSYNMKIYMKQIMLGPFYPHWPIFQNSKILVKTLSHISAINKQQCLQSLWNFVSQTFCPFWQVKNVFRKIVQLSQRYMTEVAPVRRENFSIIVWISLIPGHCPVDNHHFKTAVAFKIIIWRLISSRD